MRLKPKDLPEALTMLYLRLNGFFTTGLVIHSLEKGKDRGDMDCLAVRHMFHDQSERGVATDPFLEVRADCTELLLCEVKTSPAALSFNEPVRVDIDALRAVLRWSGLVPPEALDDVAMKLQPLLQDGVRSDLARAGTCEGGVRIRPLLSCPGGSSANVGDRWCVDGDRVLQYVNECLNPHVPRLNCSTKYNYELWGSYLQPLITYFKKLPKVAAPTFREIMKDVGGETHPRLAGRVTRSG